VQGTVIPSNHVQSQPLPIFPGLPQAHILVVSAGPAHVSILNLLERLGTWSREPGRLPQLMLLLRFQLLPLGSRAAKACQPDGQTYILYQMPTSILLNTTADFNNLIQLDNVDNSNFTVPPKGGHS
jgi:hypothetical protein